MQETLMNTIRNMRHTVSNLDKRTIDNIIISFGTALFLIGGSLMAKDAYKGLSYQYQKSQVGINLEQHAEPHSPNLLGPTLAWPGYVMLLYGIKRKDT